MPQSQHTSTARIILIVIIFVVGIAGLVFIFERSSDNKDKATAAESSTSVQQYALEPAVDESTKKDQLDAASVNLERLRQRFIAARNTPVDTAQLEATINSVIGQNKDVVFGISIKDLSTGSAYDYGNTSAMTAASVTKVITATDYLHQVELGNRSLNTIMTNGSTAQQNIEQMIVVSDNDAWHVLNENLTYSQMQSYAHSIGLTSYNYTNNTISSPHNAKLFGDIYGRLLLNESNTQLLLSYMERANYRDLIIPAVPTHNTVYHKAGEYAASLNDAAIITNATDTVVISIFTKSTATYSKPRIATLMQQITTPTLAAFDLD